MQNRLRVDEEAPMHWDLDLAEVASRSQVADKILRFASLMDTSDVPTDVIRAAVLCDGESRFGEHEFESSLYLLSHDFSLLTFNDEEQTCDIHALVQRSVIGHAKRRNKLLSSLVCLSKCIQDTLPDSALSIQHNLNNSKLIALTPHVYRVCDHILKLKCIKEECLTLLKFSCWLATCLYDITTAKHLAEGRLQICRQIGTLTIEEAFELSQSLISVGDAYNLMSRPDSAKPYFEEAVQVLEAFGFDNSDEMSYSVALGRLGCCYMGMKNLEDAERLFRKQIEWTREYADGAAAADIACALHNLAFTYNERGKYDEAIKSYEESLVLQRQLDDWDIEGMSTTLMTLAICYRETGKLEKSLSFMEEAVTIRRSYYSSSHPSLALAIRHLSSTYNLLDRKDEAMKLAREAFDIASVSLPSSHCDLALYMNKIGDCFGSRDDYNEAIVWYEKSQQLLQHLPSSLTRDNILATTLMTLGICYRETKKLKKSLSFMEEAVIIGRSCYSFSHPSLALAIRHLSSTYDLLDRKDEAMKLAREAFDIASVSLPPSHCHLASYMIGIGDCFVSRSDYNEAIVWYEKSQQLLQQLHSSSTRDDLLATTLINLGYCIEQSGNFEKSANLLEEAVTLSRSFCSPSHPQLASGLRCLAEMYDLLDRKEEALQLASKAYEMATESLPPLHSALPYYMNAVRNCYRSQGNYEEAISWHDKARKFHLKQDCSPDRDVDVARNLYLLSLDYDEKECWKEAIKMCLEAIEMERKRIFPNRTFIAIRMMRLGSYEIKTARLEESTSHLQTALSFLQDNLPTSHYTADCHFYLATLFLAMKEAYQASLHVEKCVEIRKMIFPDCHRKIREAECLKQDIGGLKENTSD
ncbi:tetratricopeptide repeat protein 28-like [Corticium candelabrum]|uniref:tetratricopeptide repeat protein 28-like n=1 Tax=Corticium candelabrum TaxID=121492 RepID=UPI002E25B274|nr:tetratricopeptide repeat protein 28-like [Corticium candelabrum]